MPAETVNVLGNFSFIVEIDGMPVAGFKEVSGLESAIEIIEYREGADKQLPVRKIPGIVKYANIVLKAGVTKDETLFRWHLDWARRTAPVKRSLSILLLDEIGQPVRVWRVKNAWPSRYIGPTLNATGNEAAIESLELTHEGLE